MKETLHRILRKGLFNLSTNICLHLINSLIFITDELQIFLNSSLSCFPTFPNKWNECDLMCWGDRVKGDSINWIPYTGLKDEVFINSDE